MLSLSRPMLAALCVFGLFYQPAARADYGCSVPGVITAKTWIDPANGHAAAGNGSTDDWQNLQDMINFAIDATNIGHVEAIQFEPGSYVISKTLMIQMLHPGDQLIGFRMSGVAAPNLTGYGPIGGVSLLLSDATHTQKAVLEIGQGALYDSSIENLALVSSTSYGTDVTPYGLLFGEQEFSHVKVDMVSVNNVGTAFAIKPGTTGGGNGESINIDNCHAAGVNCFYENDFGQALCHSIARCAFTINNGGTAVKIGPHGAGMGLDVTSLCGTFGAGPLRNTLIECNHIPSALNWTGGRVEFCDTIIHYIGGGPSAIGHITIRGMDFDACGLNALTYPGFGLVDDTLNGANGQQFTNTIEQCRFNGSYGSPFPALKLTTLAGDHSENFFDRDTFTGYSNKLTDLTADLSHLGAVVTHCRSAIGATGGSLFTDISYP